MFALELGGGRIRISRTIDSIYYIYSLGSAKALAGAINCNGSDNKWVAVGLETVAR